MTDSIEFQITGTERIHCAGCEGRIAFALRRLPGVRDARASAETQRISVTFDSDEVGPERVRARLQELGYEVAS